MMGVVVGSWAVLAAVMVVMWRRQLTTQNATSVDAAWSVGLGALALTYPWFVEGDPARRMLVGLLGATWAGRLAWHLIRDRVLGASHEDGRYRAMREHWGEKAPRWFFVFYQGQAAVAVLFSLPMLQAMQGGRLDAWAAVGIAVWFLAVSGESLADAQLSRFRADPANQGAVCESGLWRYSRHPNYFFEWLHWWTYVFIGHAAPLTWLGPVLMLVFLFRLTGIPYTEAQALKSRGERYREYQRTTSVFVPWWPRKRAG